jgi:hypothetical protein
MVEEQSAHRKWAPCSRTRTRAVRSGEPIYQCAEIQSRAFYDYGTFEVRMRAARASGTNSAFFTYVGSTHGRPHDEIDFEVIGRNTREVQVNTFVSGKDGHGQTVPNGTDAADEFVDYAFEWTPDRIRWFVNGKLTREISGQGENVPTHAAKIYLSLWNGRCSWNTSHLRHPATHAGSLPRLSAVSTRWAPNEFIGAAPRPPADGATQSGGPHCLGPTCRRLGNHSAESWEPGLARASLV